ncbi:hypothetical protein L202_04932 [Cryptococcus amylolentus CBS 6039]|uniref:Haloacid dehalogenase, type II n=1 Tax=Cryptococcus amylolentus CBS 6039 TaxID=1295533 RepID=A0A1E3HN82_9TREE|nr:hypothetical protein L202_04932 [Cryptococcus amylolentus CBS 6039]ODN77809.1 hypothetical protein L202_04932 [Cryptococcus amylolentus CBS 6039]
MSSKCQYYDEGIKGGISPDHISPLRVRSAFKPAFKKVDASWPLYGKYTTPPLTPEEWWGKIIYETYLEAGAPPAELEKKMDDILPNLLARFESDVGYKLFPETIESLQALKAMGVKTGIVSNADPRILKTLRSLDILSHITNTPTLSWDVDASKPSLEIYQSACRMAGEELGEGVIMVGDELKADYQGSINAGLEGRLIRRPGEWSDGAQRQAVEDLESVNVITSLTDLVKEVKERNTV